MKHRITQFGVRENPDSSRVHGLRLSVDALPATSEDVPRGLQDRQPVRVSASRTSEPGKSIITMPLEESTRERGDSAEVRSAAATVIAPERQLPVMPEPFVSASEAAQFLCVKRRYLLELARRGIAGAYPLGTGGKRKTWVFRLSELAASVVRNEAPIPKSTKPCTIGSGSPR